MGVFVVMLALFRERVDVSRNLMQMRMVDMSLLVMQPFESAAFGCWVSLNCVLRAVYGHCSCRTWFSAKQSPGRPMALASASSGSQVVACGFPICPCVPSLVLFAVPVSARLASWNTSPVSSVPPPPHASQCPPISSRCVHLRARPVVSGPSGAVTGYQDVELQLPMTERSLHRCFSLTKPITAFGLMAPSSLWGVDRGCAASQAAIKLA